MRASSAMAFLDFLIARFSLTDLPGFLLADWRGDLWDMALPADEVTDQVPVGA
jgi:hypothetical protein